MQKLEEVPINDWLRHVRESAEDSCIEGVSARGVQEEFKYTCLHADSLIGSAQMLTVAERWRLKLRLMSERAEGFDPDVRLAGPMRLHELKHAQSPGSSVRKVIDVQLETCPAQLKWEVSACYGHTCARTTIIEAAARISLVYGERGML